MKKEARRRYEAILLNAITKEGSKWELYDKDHHLGRYIEIFTYDYRLELPNRTNLWASVEYDAKKNSFQVKYLARTGYKHHKHNHVFRWLGDLTEIKEDYLVMK